MKKIIIFAVFVLLIGIAKRFLVNDVNVAKIKTGDGKIIFHVPIVGEGC